MIHSSICRHVSSKKPLFCSCWRSICGTAARTAEVDQETSNVQNSLVGRDFLSIQHFKADEIKQVLWTAKDLKTKIKGNGEAFLPLKGKTAVMMFHKFNKISHLSSELGFARLGGHAAIFGPEHYQPDALDTAMTLASMADVILASVPEQEVLSTMADKSVVPVINGMSNLLHPLQTLALFMTIQEHFGYLRGCPIAWIGDSNSVLHSLMQGCGKLGIDLSIATPIGYEPDADITIEAIRYAGKTGASFLMGNNPVEAAYRADAIVTDTWFRVGKEEEKEKNLRDFQGFQVNRKMMKEAGGNWVFMHCLPRAREEVTDDVFHGDESLVRQLAENQMWTVMALMLNQLQVYTPSIPMPKYVRG